MAIIIKNSYYHLKKLAETLGCVVKENEPMKNHTSFKIGGPAKMFIYVNNNESLRLILKFMAENELSFFTLGNGTNLLVSDEGYDGIVISLIKSDNKIEVKGNTLLCPAGVSLSKICSTALKNNLSGLEFAWGIPGTCGGALFMNAGAYGKDMSCVVSESTHITNSGELKILSSKDLQFSYRKSYYSGKSDIITSIKINLEECDPVKIKSKMQENILKRKLSQPLNYPNAGSIFKRPQNGPPAGEMIEKCGLKGLRIGGASVSTKHAGFIINEDSAGSNDVVKLVSKIKEKVFEEYGVLLECEIITLGM